MKTITMTALVALAMGLGACGKKGSSECKAYLARMSECDADFKSLSGDERNQGEELFMGFCQEAMSGQDPGGEGEAHELALRMVETARNKVQTCTSKKTCEEFNACQKETR